MHANPMQPKIDGYFARIDQRLAELSQMQQRDFLLSQERAWMANFARWQAIVAADRPMPKAFEGADAFSFHTTLAGLATRIAQTGEAR